MNVLVLVLFLLVQGSQAACLPDSLALTNKALVDISRAERAIEVFEESIRGDLPEENELIIRLEALNPRINADISKNDSLLVIQVMGGMLKHSKMSPEVLQLLLCHELGHFLGGPPLKSRNGWSSTEGQSDYYSGLKCAKLLGLNEASFADAAVQLTSIYAEVGREIPPSLNRCDERVVERTNYGYPSAQCRLDTLMAGWSEGERPRCWFND